MKKVLVGITTIIALIFTACNRDSDTILHTVLFDTGNEQTVESQTILDGKNATLPTIKLSKPDSIFDYWMLNGDMFNFTTPIFSSLTLKAKWILDKDNQKYKVKFITGCETQIKEQTILNGQTAIEPEVELSKLDSIFEYWTLNNEIFDFSTSISENITLVAKWKYADKVEVNYQTISKSDFDNWTTKEVRLVKAQINKIMKGFAWGTEVYLVDPEGNSSKDFYSWSDYGMFTFPIDLQEDQNEKSFVFKLYKDTFMSSPQLGFGDNRNYNGSNWTSTYTYGIDYFDETIRGTVTETGYDSGKGVYIITVNDTIYFPELSSSDITKIANFKGQNIYINCNKDNENWVSYNNHSGGAQISTELGGDIREENEIGTQNNPYNSLSSYKKFPTNKSFYIRATAYRLGSWGVEFYLECADKTNSKEILPNGNEYGMYSYGGIEKHFGTEKLYEVTKGLNGQLYVKSIKNL